MKISYNWLKQFLQIEETPEKVSELLTDLGLEVEGLETYESCKGGLKGVVVGQVISCDQHPNADRLKLTKVQVSLDQEPLQIVCGASNVREGIKVAVATIGTKIYSGDEVWTIKKGKIRGQESFGMLCSLAELNLGDDNAGILELSQHVEVGKPLAELYEIESDIVFDIGLTPNRSDAMSHLGVARDLRAGYQQKNSQLLELITPSVSPFNVENRFTKVDVDVQQKSKCLRYCGVTITNVKVDESPKWLKNRLAAIGVKSINNVVDVTNYVLHELGHPLHAFDLDMLSGNIEVRHLNETDDKKLITLDNIERTLHSDDLLICDSKGPIALAGVMGGESSSVNKRTRTVFIESAYFDPITVRKSAKRHSISSDASFRFERGVDINMAEYALKRATLLIQELAGGQISMDILDIYPNKVVEPQVLLSYDRVTKIIGQEIPKENIKTILSSLDIKINSVTDKGLGLVIPFYRNDVTREIDVIEEILRVYGYNEVEFSNKIHASIASFDSNADHVLQNKVAGFLVNNGFFEILTNSLTSIDFNKEPQDSIKLLNPLSQDLAVLRDQLIMTGLKTIAYNINRKRTDIKIFEFAKTYTKTIYHHEIASEYKHLGLWFTGQVAQESWNNRKTSYANECSGFFFVKSIVDCILQVLRIKVKEQQPIEQEQQANKDAIVLGLVYKALHGQDIVKFGQVDASLLDQFGIAQTVYYADFNWDLCIELLKNHNKINIKPIPKFPEVRRDLALLLDKTVKFADLKKVALGVNEKVIKKVNLFDVYQGASIEASKKSYALSFILQDDQKTLTDTQIDDIMEKIQNQFETHFQATLR